MCDTTSRPLDPLASLAVGSLGSADSGAGASTTIWLSGTSDWKKARTWSVMMSGLWDLCTAWSLAIDMETKVHGIGDVSFDTILYTRRCRHGPTSEPRICRCVLMGSSVIGGI